MQQIIVRSLQKDRLSIAIKIANWNKQFDRSNSEQMGAFIKRLRTKINGVESVRLLDEHGITISNDQPLHEVLIPPNVLEINDDCYNILLDPPTIDSICILSSVPHSGFVISARVEIANIELQSLQYIWEACVQGKWTSFSFLPSTFVTKDLEGCKIRLGCFTDGISIVYSEPVGPVVDDENVDILLKRAVPVSINSTRFMDYNILADCYMESKAAPVTNFFPYCPKEFQQRNYREPRIVAEIHAHDPHVLCLQEVEDKTFSESLRPLLSNYNGHITVIKGRFKTGCALFYKSSDYLEVHYESLALPDLYSDESVLTEVLELGKKLGVSFPNIMKDIRIRPIMSQIIVLRCIRTQTLLIVGNTHLFWDPRYHVIALLHVHALCSKIAQLRHVYQNEEGERRVNVVLCGDLNSQRGSLVHQYLTGGSFQMEDAALCDFLSSNVVNPVSFQLARGDPLYTNYTAKFRDVIDYILCDSQSTVAQVTPSHPVEYLERSEGCPSAIFPSDHLPIISDIILGDKQSDD